MRALIKLKLLILIAIWSAVCLALFAAVALGEAVLEIGADVASAAVGQGGAASGLVDLTGDVVQWGIGLTWLAGILVLWFAKRLVTSREARSATARVAVKAATTAAPFVIARHPIGRAVNIARGPAGKLLAGMLARRGARR